MGACMGKAGIPTIGGGSSSNDGGCSPDFAEIKIEKTDAFFTTVKETLDQAEALRYGLLDTKANIFEFTGLDLCETESINLKNAVNAFAISCVLDLKGEVSSFAPKITTEGIELDDDVLSKLSDNNKAIYKNLKLFIETAKGLPETAPGLAEKVGKLPADATEATSTITDDISGAGLNPMDAAKAAKNTASNSKTLAETVAKFVKIFSAPTLVTDTAAEIKALIEGTPAVLAGLKEQVDKAKEKATDGKLEAPKVTTDVLDDLKKLAADALKTKQDAGKAEKDLLKQRREKRSGKSGDEAKPAAAAAAPDAVKPSDKTEEKKDDTQSADTADPTTAAAAAVTDATQVAVEVGGEMGARV